MMMIVFLHVNSHYRGSDEALYQMPHLFMYLQVLAMVCVNLFVMITGYFMVTSARKMSRWFKLVFQVSFFALIISGVIVALGYDSFTLKTFLQNLLPILFDHYWFVTMYVILYLIAPYLNFFLNQAPRNASFAFIFILFVVGCIWEPALGVEHIGFGNGFNLISFIFVYLLGGYIRKYDHFVIHFKRSWHYFALFFGLGAISALLYQWTHQATFLRYNHWITVLMTYGLFMGFKTMKLFVSRPINMLAKNVFGVYLVHEHPMVRQLLHDSVPVSNFLSLDALYFTLRAITLTLVVFTISWLVATVLNAIYDALFNWIQPKVTGAWHAWIGD